MTLSFQTPGYEHLELSTQLIIAEALKRGLQVEVIDEDEQFIRLSDGQKTEYIKEATKTSADSYITSEILGNKHIAKKLLNEKNIATPAGKKYNHQTNALNDFNLYQKGKWVIKPTTTNYGIGISIVENPGRPEYEHAVKEAFKHDSTILVETFIPGIECRFLVINGVCRAVLNRLPANVTGDGKNSISELINLKNSDPRRGKGYKTPLEFLQKGEVERKVLAKQGLNFESVPRNDQTIFIRHNSNISTGGDSIDFTDQVHESYKKIAVEAAKTAQAKIGGIDLIMSEHQKPAKPNNHAVIELNYNPVLYFHDYPYEGKNRQTARYVLDLLRF